MRGPQPRRGRSEPRGRARAALRRSRQHGSRGLLMITGPAGIGKTALLADTIRQARAMNYRVGSSKCDAIEQIWPAAPVVAALRQGREPLLTAAEYEQIHRYTERPLLLAERIAAHLERIAEYGPLLIAVDDVQWADRVSRFVLRTLLARCIGLPIVLALARRDPRIAGEMALPSLAGGADAEALSRAVDSGLVDATGGSLTVRHDLVREAVYAGIDETERQRLHERIATHLIASGSDLLAIAAHARAAAIAGDAGSAGVLLQAAEKLATVSADDAGELALIAFRVLRPPHPGWLAVGRRSLAVLVPPQRAADALALADATPPRGETPHPPGP